MTKKTLSTKKKGNAKFAIEIMDNTEEGGIKGMQLIAIRATIATRFNMRRKALVILFIGNYIFLLMSNKVFFCSAVRFSYPDFFI